MEPTQLDMMSEDDLRQELDRVVQENIKLRGKINKYKSREDILKNLYIKVNEVMCVLGAEGQLESFSDEVGSVMDALFVLDGGVYDVEKAFKL